MPEQDPVPTDPQVGGDGNHNQEAAKYRTERNAALRRAHAYEAMLRAHNIDIASVTDDSLRGMEIDQGAVVEEYSYTPPPMRRSDPAGAAAPGGQPASTQQPLTMTSLKDMSSKDRQAALDGMEWADIEAMMRGS